MRKVKYEKSLEFKNPELAKEWHPTKNGTLRPENVTAGSNKVVWWYLPYDDPETCEHYNFEWKTSVLARQSGNRCPYLSGRAVWPGFNDLATKNPGLAKEWHPSKNGKLTPRDFTAGSKKVVWWYLPYDDPETGEHHDFEWKAMICDRNRGIKCPYPSGQAVWPGFNDLATKNPELAKEWHPSKNGKLTPRDVTAGSTKVVWWYLPYDDPETREHFNFEWKMAVAYRNAGKKCPYLCGQAVWPGFNDLASKNPELAKEWHPSKNGKLTPKDVTADSGKVVWWYLPFADPETGKRHNFEWKADIKNRNRGDGCPYISGRAVWPGFNDLATKNPGLAKEWHPSKNGKLTPRDVTAGSPKVVWWYLPYDDPETCEHFNFEWKADICSRNSGSGCPYISGRAVWPGFNDLKTRNPKLAKEWNEKKNKTIKKDRIFYKSKTKVWWECSTCGHEWRMSVRSRNLYGFGCPKCHR